jgi:MFS-type transporter involved in bile tolerance (Atg22 family)
VYKKVRQAKQLSQLFSLLIFWFFVSDSASTILKVAVLFAQNDVHVSSEKTLIGAVLDLFCAVPGMLFWHFLQKRFKLKPKTLIFGLTILTGAVPIYVLGGLSPLPGG